MAKLKLSMEKRSEIQNLYSVGEKTYKQIADEYKISMATVGNIIRERKENTEKGIRYSSATALHGAISSLKLAIAAKHQEIKEMQKSLEGLLKLEERENENA